MADQKPWTPDKEAALKALIRQTIAAAGSADPATLPHRVKQLLKDQASGGFDVEAYAKQVLKEQRRKGGA